MSSLWSRRMLRRGLVVAVVLLVLAGGAVAFVLLHSPGNVSHPNLSFTGPKITPRPKAEPTTYFIWPRYGYDGARTHLFPNSRGLNPPLRQGWRYGGGSLLEFSPVIYGNSLFILNDDGLTFALDKRNGRMLWQNKVGTLAAASPAVGDGLVFVPLLSTQPGAGQSQNPGAGKFVAMSQKDGKVVWSRDISAGTESSPLVWGQTVYFGDQSGTMYALNAKDGRQIWTYHASAAVKGGPAISEGTIYFGDYAGRAYALRAGDGHEEWAVSTNGARFGFGSGTFYSSPSVAFGRVYMGNTDGRVYSFAAHSGQLAWATGTGSYVYGSPAVADVPGVGPTVYVGSYDGNFYAFDARSGAVRWSHPAGGKISGSATIVGDVVYYASLGGKNTAGLDIRTGRQVFFWPEGSYNPVIADAGAIYLTGYADLLQMVPQHGGPSPAQRKPTVPTPYWSF